MLTKKDRVEISDSVSSGFEPNTPVLGMGHVGDTYYTCSACGEKLEVFSDGKVARHNWKQCIEVLCIEIKKLQ